jgi:hypothetical protein
VGVTGDERKGGQEARAAGNLVCLDQATREQAAELLDMLDAESAKCGVRIFSPTNRSRYTPVKGRKRMRYSFQQQEVHGREEQVWDPLTFSGVGSESKHLRVFSDS